MAILIIYMEIRLCVRNNNDFVSIHEWLVSLARLVKHHHKLNRLSIIYDRGYRNDYCSYKLVLLLMSVLMRDFI